MNPPTHNGSASAPPHWLAIDWSNYEKSATLSGRRLNYVDYGKGDVVVLVHGLGGCWQLWLENIPTLGLHHRVIAVDLPGFGRSEPLPEGAELADHVEALIDLLDQLSIPDAVVVGHSLGGLITLCMAHWRTERVRGLALVSGGGVELSPLRLGAILGVARVFRTIFGLPGVAATVAARPLLRRILLGGTLGDWRSLTPELAAIHVPLMSAPGFVATARAGAAALPSIHPELIGAPVLLIWGQVDRLLPVAAARTMAAAMPNASLVVLDGIGHYAMFEEPAVVNDLLLEFLEENSRTTTIDTDAR